MTHKRISLLLLISLIITGACHDETIKPSPPELTRTLIVTTGPALKPAGRSRYILITDLQNHRLYADDFTEGETLTIKLPEDQISVNIHIAAYSDERFDLQSLIGYDQDTYHLGEVEESDDLLTGRVSAYLSSVDGLWVLNMGPKRWYKHGDFLGSGWNPALSTSITEKSSLFYFMRQDQGVDDVTEGYYFNPGISAGEHVNLDEVELSPLSELTLVNYQVPEHLADNPPSVWIFGRPYDKNGVVQDFATLFEIFDYHPYWENTEIRVPDFGYFKEYYSAIYSSTERDENILINRAEQITAKPEIPGFIDADIIVNSAEFGSVSIQGTGNYNGMEFHYYADNLRCTWDVTILDETADYASYPDFPSEFDQNLNYGSKTDWLQFMEQRHQFTGTVFYRTESGISRKSEIIFTN